MSKYLSLWKDLKKEIGLSIILDSLFASLFYSLFVLFPTVLIVIQVISMYYYLLNLWIVLLTVFVILISVLQLWMWKKTIILHHTEISTDIHTLFNIQKIMNAVVLSIIGLLFIFIFIPMMQI